MPKRTRRRPPPIRSQEAVWLEIYPDRELFELLEQQARRARVATPVLIARVLRRALAEDLHVYRQQQERAARRSWRSFLRRDPKMRALCRWWFSLPSGAPARRRRAKEAA